MRRNFMFYPELDAEKPSAADLMLLNLCRRMNTLQNSPQDEAPKAETAEGASQDAVKPAQPLATDGKKSTASPARKQKAGSKGKTQPKIVSDTKEKKSLPGSKSGGKQGANAGNDAKEKQSLPGTKSGGKQGAIAADENRKQSLPETKSGGKQGANAGTWKAGSMTASQARKSGDEDPVGSWGDEDDVENIEEAWIPEKQTPAKQSKAQATGSQKQASGSKKAATGGASGDEVSGAETEAGNERIPAALMSGKAITKADLDVSTEDEYDYDETNTAAAKDAVSGGGNGSARDSK